jgi:hypothetical protein
MYDELRTAYNILLNKLKDGENLGGTHLNGWIL